MSGGTISLNSRGAVPLHLPGLGLSLQHLMHLLIGLEHIDEWWDDQTEQWRSPPLYTCRACRVLGSPSTI